MPPFISGLNMVWLLNFGPQIKRMEKVKLNMTLDFKNHQIYLCNCKGVEEGNKIIKE